MAKFSHTIELARPPVEVFPWLLEEDKVPRWTGHLTTYERIGDGPLRPGAQLRQVLEIAGRRLDLTLEVTAYDPPRSAETRFSSNGVDVVNGYLLEPAGTGSRLTQTLDAKPTSLSARMMVSVVRPRLEQKLTEDLERLRETLSATG